MDNVNRNDAGYVDFEKMVGLDGIALINIVGNPHEAPLTGRKLIQTRITHNDGRGYKIVCHGTVTDYAHRWHLALVGPAPKGFSR